MQAEVMTDISSNINSFVKILPVAYNNFMPLDKNIALGAFGYNEENQLYFDFRLLSNKIEAVAH